MPTSTLPSAFAEVTSGLRVKPPLSMWVALGLVLVAFAKPLLQLAQLALSSQVYSYIILMPFITGYLLYTNKKIRWQFNTRPAIALPVVLLAVGVATLAGYFWAVRTGWKPQHDDYLATMTFAFLAFFFAILAAYLHAPTLRQAAYPLALLVFLAPFPTPLLHALETALQHLSADVAHGMLVISGMPLIRDGTQFRLPGFSMQVAPECSGIRSTLALFITSLVAGYMLLRSPWRRAVLAICVLPLALLRNGFRIWTISELCVNVDPEMIHSFIHKKGGPIFFALSLIPFGLLLIWLVKSEKKRRSNPA